MENGKGHAVTHVSQVTGGEVLQIQVTDGRIQAKVLGTKQEERGV